MKCKNCGAEAGGNFCEYCGSEMPKETPVVYITNNYYGDGVPQPPVKETKRKTWLWVLGWIFLFPVPLTVLLVRNKDMKPAVKYGIIAAAWVVYLLIGMFGGTT